MSSAVAVIIWTLLTIIAGLSALLLYAVFGVISAIKKLNGEQKVTNSLLREIVRTQTDPDARTTFKQ
ncbi:MAG: hypothetical protein U5P41_05330 [Gammaproteobacteria bacterium]|nr:hypothetical protein [Gammaproteobacteria bacterium]